MNESAIAALPSPKVQIWQWTQLEGDPWSPLQRGIYTALIILELIGSSITIALIIRRRNSYPVNATPVLWNVLSHLSPPLSAIFYGFEDVLRAMQENPFGLFMLCYCITWPMVPAICARLLYVVRSYQEQIRIEKRQKQLTKRGPSGGAMAMVKHGRHLSKDKEVLLFFVAVSVINLLFPLGVIYDRYVLHFEKDPNVFIEISPGLFVTSMCLILYCFVFAFLAFKLKNIKEEFNLRAQYLRFSIWAMSFESANLLMVASGLHRKSGDMLLMARFFFHLTNAGCTLFCGVLSLMFSYREEEKMRRRMTHRNSMASSNGSSREPRVFTVKSANDLKKICTNPKNTAQLDKFQSYTIKEFCVENVLCARAIMHLTDISDKAKLLEAVHRILNEHIRPGVQAEVNVADGLRKRTITNVAKLTEETVTDAVYQEVEYELYLMLLDCFNRFLVKEDIVLDFAPRQSSV